MWQILNICFSSKSDATYVINYDEYERLATKIVKRSPSRPIIVFVEMPDVVKAFAKASIASLYVHYLSYFSSQKRNGNTLFLPSDDEDGDAIEGGGDDTDADEVSIV